MATQILPQAPRVPKSVPQKPLFSRISLVLRRVHMFVALFLAPWIAMYALSTVVFNHGNFIAKLLYGGDMEQWIGERQVPYFHTFPPDADNATIARQVEADMGMSGDVRIADPDDDGVIVITHVHPVTTRRLIFNPSKHRVTVEKQDFRLPNFLTRLHARVGYNTRTPALRFWAFAVDLTVAATVVWIVSGLWMWWELKVTRRTGALFFVLGIALFAAFLSLA